MRTPQPARKWLFLPPRVRGLRRWTGRSGTTQHFRLIHDRIARRPALKHRTIRSFGIQRKGIGPGGAPPPTGAGPRCALFAPVRSPSPRQRARPTVRGSTCAARFATWDQTAALRVGGDSGCGVTARDTAVGRATCFGAGHPSPPAGANQRTHEEPESQAGAPCGFATRPRHLATLEGCGAPEPSAQ